MLKYESSTLKIYIRNIKHYTDIDPTADFVFPVNKIDRVHQLFVVTSLQLLLPVIQTFFFGTKIFNPQKKISTKIKCLLFSPKPQKFHTAEITGYTVRDTFWKIHCQKSSRYVIISLKYNLTIMNM
jgi:hypothetical protein